MIDGHKPDCPTLTWLRELRGSVPSEETVNDRDSIERGLRAVLDDLSDNAPEGTWYLNTAVYGIHDLPRLVEIFQKAAKE